MHMWSPVNGDIEIIVESLLPADFTAKLRLQQLPGSPARDIAPVSGAPGGTYRFRVTAAEVQAIKTSSHGRLMLRTTHKLLPGSFDPRWGWRYTVSGPPGPLNVTEQGNPVALDAQGYFETQKSPYPAPPIKRTNKAIRFQ